MSGAVEYQRDGLTVSTDPARLDRQWIRETLAQTYWSMGIPGATVDRAIDHSLCFGLYEGERQVGFARLVTDYATFAYLADVFVHDEYRGRKLGVWLMECVMAHPLMPGLRRILLATRDAHGLYERFGFAEPENPKMLMQIMRPDIYRP